MNIITLKRLNKGLFQVQSELERAGFYDEALQKVDVFLVPFGKAYGWQYYGTTGEIHIPAISFSKLKDVWNGNYTSLRDVLRHEYGHAVADTHRGLMRSLQFTRAFGASQGASIEWEFDPEFHVSEYAATSPLEDFAETFMFFLRHGGKLPSSLRTPAIQAKWTFIRKLGSTIRSGKRRWATQRAT